MNQFKDEGIIGVVNLIGDYHYVECYDVSGDDLTKMMQVRGTGGNRQPLQLLWSRSAYSACCQSTDTH